MIYLDYQATTPLAPEALEAMLLWLGGPGSDGFANPSSQYRAGRAASVAVELARDEVASLLPKRGQVHFTSGATEALNWALIRAPRLAPGGLAGSAFDVLSAHVADSDTGAHRAKANDQAGGNGGETLDVGDELHHGRVSGWIAD